MAYDAKCPSCGARNVLEESQLGLSVACIKCHKDWMFDGPIRQRKAARAADDLKRGREVAIKKARLVNAAKAVLDMQPQYSMLQAASWCCYAVSGMSALGIIMLVYYSEVRQELGSESDILNGYIIIIASQIVSIIFFGAMGSALAAFRDMAINSWKLVNKE